MFVHQGKDRRKEEERVRGENRLPPGQALTLKFPVLHYGPVPTFNPSTWDLRVWGEVEEEKRWTWDEFNQLPRMKVTMDLHCVTRWSKFDTRWEGVLMRDLVDQAGVAHVLDEQRLDLLLAHLADEVVEGRRHARPGDDHAEQIRSFARGGRRARERHAVLARRARRETELHLQLDDIKRVRSAGRTAADQRRHRARAAAQENQLDIEAMLFPNAFVRRHPGRRQALRRNSSRHARPRT